ncbi:MAG: hypothetical protein N2589_06540, partial [bacterium]|nr:hypothetical protein [bacterium]
SIFSNFKEVLNDIILINGYWTSFFFLIMLFFSLFKFKKQLSIFYVGLGLILILLSITSGFKYARYYLPLLIFVVLIVSFSIKEMGNIKKSKILIYIISVFTIGFNFLKTTSCLNLMSSKDTRIISAEYIDKEIKEGNRIVFLKSPWIFEVCPVNFFKYNIIIIENEEELINIPENSYLVIGEFQYFLTKGSRKKNEENIIEKMRNYGFFLVKKFEKKAFFYPNDRTIHDLIYFCPQIFLFYKNERSF